MSPNPPLTRDQQFKAVALRERGLSYRKIAKEIGFSKSGLDRFFKDPANYNTKRSSGRPKKLNTRDIRRISRAQGSPSKSCSTIAKELQLPIHRQTVWRTLKSLEHYSYIKKKQTLNLSNTHKEKRINWAMNHAHWNLEWSSVIFSDEKNSIWTDLMA